MRVIDSRALSSTLMHSHHVGITAAVVSNFSHSSATLISWRFSSLNNFQLKQKSVFCNNVNAVKLLFTWPLPKTGQVLKFNGFFYFWWARDGDWLHLLT